MNLKLDENIPARVQVILKDLSHTVDTVPQEGLTGQNDQTIWDAAQQARRFLIR